MRILNTLFFFFLLGGVQAQECLPTFLELSSQFESNEPVFAEWDLYQVPIDGPILESGSGLFTSEATVLPFSLCLEPGCYFLSVGTGVMLEAFDLYPYFDVAGGFISEFNLTYENQFMQLEFCLAQNQECNLEVAVNNDAPCNAIALNAVDYNSNANLFWTVNGEPHEGGSEFLFEAQEAGAYQVCVAYETPDCPEGVFWCETFAISPECFEGESPCDLSIAVNESPCHIISLSASGMPEGAVLGWFINGDFQGTGPSFLYEAQLAGSYQVCVAYETPDCPEGVEWCETFAISEDCLGGGSSCDLSIAVNESPCHIISLTASEMPEGALLEWFINGDFQGTGPSFLYEAQLAGSYQVCVAYETPDCPEGVEWCETFAISEDCIGGDCAITLDMEQLECGHFFFEAGLPNGWQSADWFVNGEAYGIENASQEIIFSEEGLYEVCVVFQNNDCPATEACMTVEVEGCVESCTESNLQFFSGVNNGGPSEIYYYLIEEGVGGIEDGVLEFSGDQIMNEVAFCLPAGCYLLEILAPDGGLEADFAYLLDFPMSIGSFEVLGGGDSSILLEICVEPTLTWPEEEDCSLDINYELNEDGNYLITASGPESAEIKWTVNGNMANIGDEWVFEPTLPGVFEICAFYDNVCEGVVQSCFTIAGVPNEECTPVVMHISTEDDLVNSAIVNTLIESIEVNFGFEVNLYDFDASTTLGICLPDGCYEWTVGLTEFLVADLLINIEIDGEAAIDYQFDLENQQVTLELPVNADCGTGIRPARAQSEMQIYPNPTRAVLNVQGPFDGPSIFRVFDLTGRMQMSGNLDATGASALPVSELTPGVYVIELEQDGRQVRERFVVQR